MSLNTSSSSTPSIADILTAIVSGDTQALAVKTAAKTQEVKLRRLIDQGWEAFYREIYSNSFVDCLDSAETDDTHHSEAIIWHWESRIALLEDRTPEYYAYFPIWPRGNLKCVDEHTGVLMANGNRKPIKDTQVGEIVQSFDEITGKIVLKPILNKWKAGKKDCWQLRTRSGRKIISTPDHWYRTFAGWKQLKDITPSDRIASPRNTIGTTVDFPITDEEIRLVTYFLMEGSTTTHITKGSKGNGSCGSRLTSADAVIVNDMRHCAESLGFELTKVKDDKPDGTHRYGYNMKSRDGDRYSAKNFIKRHQMDGKKATAKRLPLWFYELSERQIKQVVASVLDTDGFIGQQDIGVTLANPDLIQDLRYLFSKIGIVCKEYKVSEICAGAWSLLFDKHNLERLTDLPLRLKHTNWAKLLSKPRYSLTDCYPHSIVLSLPKGVNRRLRREIKWKPSRHPRITRDKLQRALNHFEYPLWRWLEDADVFWDEIHSIEHIGTRTTYDIEVADTHNFIADGLVVHNSTLAEMLVVTDALLSVAYGQSGFCLYLGREKHRVRENIANIEALLSRAKIREYAPQLSECAKNEETNSKRQWTGSFLHTAAGYVVKGGTVESSQAGSRIKHLGDDGKQDTRPTFFVPDDIDSREDSPVIAETRFRLLTTEILPMRQQNSLTFYAQNLISRYSTMFRIQQGGARVLTNRKPTVPIPAVRDLITETQVSGGIVRDKVVAGRPTWRVWTLDRVQTEIDTMGLPAFLRECQHEVADDREGLILSNYDDAVHVISESEFAWKYGAADAWLRWPKRPANDWATTKTDKHANVAGWLTRSPQNTALPNVEFLFPLSFPAETSPEDVAERLLSMLSPTAYGSVTWRDLRQAVVKRADASTHTTSDAERLAYERGATAKVIPTYTTPLLKRCAVQQGAISHERKTIRELYAQVYGMGFRAVNPGKFGAIETMQSKLRIERSEVHPFRPDVLGYTAFYIVAPDDLSDEGEMRDGVRVYPPLPFPSDYRSDDLHDAALCRFQLRNCRYSAPQLTATGERIDEPLKLYDDFFNMLQMLYVSGGIGDVPLTEGEKVALLIPDDVHQNRKTAVGAEAKLGAKLDYDFHVALAEDKLRPADYTGLEDWV